MYNTNSIAFTLIINNLIVKYISKESLMHLITKIQKKYTITINREIDLFIDVSL